MHCFSKLIGGIVLGFPKYLFAQAPVVLNGPRFLASTFAALDLLANFVDAVHGVDHHPAPDRRFTGLLFHRLPFLRACLTNSFHVAAHSARSSKFRPFRSSCSIS